MKTFRMVSAFILSAAIFLTAMGTDAADRKRDVASVTLRTEIMDRRRVFVGVGGKIDGVVNPTFFATEWDVLEVTLMNGDGLNHHIAFPDFHIMSDEVMDKGRKTVVTFVPFKKGGFVYYCILDNHRQLGMEGRMVVIGR